MKEKSYNYKYIIGIILGFLSVTVVYAASGVSASNVINDGKYASSSSKNVQGTIDYLAEQFLGQWSCPKGYTCTKKTK
jgi:hypothetical protein